MMKHLVINQYAPNPATDATADPTSDPTPNAINFDENIDEINGISTFSSISTAKPTPNPTKLN